MSKRTAAGAKAAAAAEGEGEGKAAEAGEFLLGRNELGMERIMAMRGDARSVN